MPRRRRSSGSIRTKLAELRKQQQDEKLQLVERHKKDNEVVQKVTKEAKLKKQAVHGQKEKGRQEQLTQALSALGLPNSFGRG